MFYSLIEVNLGGQKNIIPFCLVAGTTRSSLGSFFLETRILIIEKHVLLGKMKEKKR